MTKTLTTALAGAFCLLAVPAHALNTRTWVSGTGTDSASCGPIAAPCRTLQWAHDNTSAGDEIDVKDSAGYGSVVITKAINIVGDGSLAGVLAGVGVNAITINAGPSDKITLRGLTIEGAGVGANGVVFNSGGQLTIADCVVQGFVGNNFPAAGNGILLQPSSGNPTFTIVNTAASDNVWAGVIYRPASGNASAQIAIDRSTFSNDGYGIYFDGSPSSGTSSAWITGSSVAHATNNGIIMLAAKISIDLTTVGGSVSGSGIAVGNGGILTIGRSQSVNNLFYGLSNYGPGTVFSYGDNRFGGNPLGQTNGAIGSATLK